MQWHRTKEKLEKLYLGFQQREGAMKRLSLKVIFQDKEFKIVRNDIFFDGTCGIYRRDQEEEWIVDTAIKNKGNFSS